MKKTDRQMSENEIYLYGDNYNEVFHFIRCFNDPNEEGDYIHTCIKMAEIDSILRVFHGLEDSYKGTLESIAKPIGFTKCSENTIEFNGAIFSGGWITKFTSLRINIKVIETINRILLEKGHLFFDERKGPIIIDGSLWWTCNIP